MQVNWLGAAMTGAFLVAGIVLVAMKQVELGNTLIGVAIGSFSPNPLRKDTK